MIELIQQKNNLIGSEDAIMALSEKNHGRVLVASDSHNNFTILLDILKQFGPSCDAFAFCGDGLSDIANIYSLASEDEDIRKVIPPVIAFVGGNCDPSVYPISLTKKLTAPPKQVLNVNGQNILIVHGHRESVDFCFDKLAAEMKRSGCKTGLFGHTHIAEDVYTNNDIRFINPGSCSSPRGGQPKSFAILTVEKTFIDAAFIEITYEDSDLDNVNKKGYRIWQPN